MKRKNLLALELSLAALSITGIAYSDHKLAFPTQNQAYNNFCTLKKFINTPTEEEILSGEADPIIERYYPLKNHPSVLREIEIRRPYKYINVLSHLALLCSLTALYLTDTNPHQRSVTNESPLHGTV